MKIQNVLFFALVVFTFPLSGCSSYAPYTHTTQKENGQPVSGASLAVDTMGDARDAALQEKPKGGKWVGNRTFENKTNLYYDVQKDERSGFIRFTGEGKGTIAPSE